VPLVVLIVFMILVLRSDFFAVTETRSLSLHELDQRVHVQLRQVQPGHLNLLVLLEQRGRDRIFLVNQFVRLTNHSAEPGSIANAGYTQQIRPNLIAVANCVTRSTARRKKICPLVDIKLD